MKNESAALHPPQEIQLAQKDLNVFDVIVLGAGSIGVATAMRLAEAGKRVVVLDAHPSVGQGDNKRAIGGVRATFGNPGKILVGMESLQTFRTWEKVHGDDIE